jgi:beta-phosphoglucomutase-like phosphatase (HAD superfamily)
MQTKKNVFPKALLFDMDGVLIDSQNAWWKAINVALSCSNHPTITRKEFINHLWGNDFKKTMTYLDIDAGVFLDCTTWPPIYLKHVILKNDAISTLSTLQKKYQLALITNTQRYITEQVLDQFKLTSFFNAIVCADDVKNGKPAPDIIFHACRLLEVSVSDSVVIGDTQSDYLACKHAGCQMIGMNFENNGQSIQYLSELPHMITQLNRRSDYSN